MTGDRDWMLEAIELSRLCPPSPGAFSVGAVLVGADGREIVRGHSREGDPTLHAEEAAFDKLAAGPRGAVDLRGATLYSTLEPCSRRSTPRATCTERTLAAGVTRVVIAWREPALFVDCVGVETLRAAGVEVVELPELADLARAVNAHLL